MAGTTEDMTMEKVGVVSRRTLLGGIATAAAAASLAGLVGPSSAEAVEPTQYAMSRDEALAELENEAEFTEDLVLDDGTVIPAVFVRVRNRINRIGQGIGSDVDTSKNYWAFAMRAFSEEEAEYYLDMPLTKDFTAAEMAVKTGRDQDKCLEICEALASRGILYRTRRGGQAFFRLIPQINGIWEYSIGIWDQDDDYDVEYLGMHWGQYGGGREMADSDTPPFFRSLPVNAEVIGDEGVMSPFDDYEAIIRRHTVIARGDCVCRENARALGNPELDENCERFKSTEILTGEEAEYYIENGIGWPITQDEALEVLHDAVDAGLVIQVAFSKASEIFCCCCGDTCKMLGTMKALNGGRTMQYYSHYNLEHDKDACIKCGVCSTRCHLNAITYDEEGYPVTGGSCVRCGQCAVTCPAEARKLFLIEDYPELPDRIVDTDLNKAVERMQQGQIRDFVPGM